MRSIITGVCGAGSDFGLVGIQVSLGLVGDGDGVLAFVVFRHVDD